jgi:hypothetical protein
MSKPTLYDLSVEGLQIQQILEENEGELTTELEQRLDALMIEGPERIEAAAMVVRALEAQQQACIDEMQRLGQRGIGFGNNAKRLKERIRIALDCAFGGKVKTARFTIWNQTSAATVAFDLAEEFTPEMLAEDYPALVRTKVELNKTALKEAFERGESLPEAVHIEEIPGTRYVRIK